MSSTTIRAPYFEHFEVRDVVMSFLQAIEEHPCDAFLQMMIALEDKTGREVLPDVLRTQIYRLRRKIRRISALPNGLNRLAEMLDIDADDLRRFEQLKGVTARRGLRQRARQLVESGIHDNQILIERLKSWASGNLVDQPTPGSLEVIASATRSEYGLTKKEKTPSPEWVKLYAEIVRLRHDCYGPKDIGIHLHVPLNTVRGVLDQAAKKGERFPSLKRLRIGQQSGTSLAA